MKYFDLQAIKLQTGVLYDVCLHHREILFTFSLFSFAKTIHCLYFSFLSVRIALYTWQSVPLLLVTVTSSNHFACLRFMVKNILLWIVSVFFSSSFSASLWKKVSAPLNKLGHEILGGQLKLTFLFVLSWFSEGNSVHDYGRSWSSRMDGQLPRESSAV